jgi:translation initiation factor 5B
MRQPVLLVLWLAATVWAGGTGWCLGGSSIRRAGPSPRRGLLGGSDLAKVPLGEGEAGGRSLVEVKDDGADQEVWGGIQIECGGQMRRPVAYLRLRGGASDEGDEGDDDDDDDGSSSVVSSEDTSEEEGDGVAGGGAVGEVKGEEQGQDAGGEGGGGEEESEEDEQESEESKQVAKAKAKKSGHAGGGGGFLKLPDHVIARRKEQAEEQAAIAAAAAAAAKKRGSKSKVGKPAVAEHGDEDWQDGEDGEDGEDEDGGVDAASRGVIAKAKEERMERIAEAKGRRSADVLRSPILCVLGHVDTGKTKILDRIRSTNVQEGEAGGITQQIGATFFPTESIKKVCGRAKVDFKVPGLLVIDTPGHESFSNLRSRGASLCDICVLVVDLMHGLEPQTIESLQLLKRRRCPFIVALNKVDRCYGWKPKDGAPFKESFNSQPKNAKDEFTWRWEDIRTQIAEQGLNSELYYLNKDPRKTVSVVPTSALTGEGIPDMLALVVSLTQKLLVDRLMLSEALEASVLEVKVLEGLGTTVDVVLTQGTLNEGDTIVLCGLQGPIVTSIRSLLTPHPMKELRVRWHSSLLPSPPLPSTIIS